MDLKRYINEKKKQIDNALLALIPSQDTYPPMLHKAMHYSLFSGGKRLRPILHLATVEACGGDVQECMPFACALELIHTYSLIHDDLPAIDDDDLRRGRPTSHKVFGEAIAILAGDALLTEAFRVITRHGQKAGLDHRAVIWAAFEVAHAAGSQGMVGGQAMDILSEGKEGDAEVLHYIHSRKTGALIRASVISGAILSGVTDERMEKLGRYGEKLGLAFQIRDDMLNVEGDVRKLGKSVGSDAQRGKLTYPSVFGLEAARLRQEELIEEALQELSGFDHRAEPLREIAKYTISRER